MLSRVAYGQGCQSLTSALTRAIKEEQQCAVETAVTAIRKEALAVIQVGDGKLGLG